MPASNAFASTDSLYDALMAEEALFDRLVAHHPPFARFAKVLLSERTAPRLDLADVARMADLPVADFVALVNRAPRAAPVRVPPPAEPAPRPAWLDDSAAMRRRLDLRPIFESGHEPLADILDVVETLAPGEILVLEAPFHPMPLRRLLGGRGFASHAETLAADHWRIHFRRQT